MPTSKAHEDVSEIMDGVDGGDGKVSLESKDGRLFVRCVNQGGYDFTDMDLRQLLQWVAKNHPKEIVRALSEAE